MFCLFRINSTYLFIIKFLIKIFNNAGNGSDDEINEEDLGKPEPEEPAVIPEFPKDCIEE
jgi:hypothetical protein